MSQLPKVPSSQGMAGTWNLPPLDAATPSVDAFAKETNAAPVSPGYRRRWEEPRTSEQRANSGYNSLVLQEDDGKLDEDNLEELRRRAAEWVNNTVPMQSADDELMSSIEPGSCGRESFDVWDSDEEGVATRMRKEAQPEAGAGADQPAPFFMQVLAKQFGKK